MRRSRQRVGIHLDHETIRVIRLREDKRGFTVQAVARSQRTHGDLAADFGRLFGKTRLFTGKAVIVTEDVRFLSIDLDAAGSDNLTADKLLAAATWEMEPFLDFPPSEGLFQCRRLPDAQHSGDTVSVLIAAVFRKTYENLAGLLKGFGLHLVAAYAPQAALACATDLPAYGKNKILLDIGEEDIKAVLLSDHGPIVFQDNPLSPGMGPSVDRIQDAVYGLGMHSAADVEIVLSGPAVSQSLVTDLSRAFPLVRTWGETEFPEIRQEPDADDFGPADTLATGAVLGSWGRFESLVPAATDRVPIGSAIAKTLEAHRRFIPIAVLGGFLVCLGAHYGYLHYRMSRYTAAIRQLEKEKQRLESPLAETRRLKQEIAVMKSRQRFIQETLPAQNRYGLTLFRGLAQTVPPDVVVNKIDQCDECTFVLSGNAYRGKAITDFSVALATLEACDGTFLERVRRQDVGAGARDRIMPYHFEIRVRFSSAPDGDRHGETVISKTER